MNWIDVAQDIHKRQAIVDMVMYEGTSKSFRTLFFKKSLFMLQT